MQFSEELTKKVRDPLRDKGITLTDDEVTTAFNTAMNYFYGEGTLAESPPNFAVPVALAVEALKEAFGQPDLPEQPPVDPSPDEG